MSLYAVQQSATPRHRIAFGTADGSASHVMGLARLGQLSRSKNLSQLPYIRLPSSTTQQQLLQPPLINPISSQPSPPHSRWLRAQMLSSSRTSPLWECQYVILLLPATCPVSAAVEPAIGERSSQWHRSRLPSEMAMLRDGPAFAGDAPAD